MEQIIATLEKIRTIARSTASYSSIEKDLMLQYTRDLYETILALGDKPAAVAGYQELTEEPEPHPEAIIEEEDMAAAAATVAAEDAEPLAEQSTADVPEAETIIAEAENVQAHTEQEVPDLQEEERRVEEPGVQDEPDRSEQYTDLAAVSEEAPQLISFELEPELQEEKPAPFQPRHSTDFRVWNKDIRSYIGINDKYNFISELFKGNSEAYDEILTEINQCESKQDALRFLENAGITTLYHWKEDGFSEQIFYNVLSQFFAAR